MSNGKKLIYHYSVLCVLLLMVGYIKYIINSYVHFYIIILYIPNRKIVYNNKKFYFF